jgi:tRNA threonylcarbamoyladenosine biosynthesis protein TsaE
MKRFVTHGPEETVALGKSFAGFLKPGDIVALSGNLGSGKTLFVMGVCEGLGTRGHISSPTFTLINEYPAPFGLVAHIDLYRIRARAEVSELGIDEYFNDRTVVLIEWAESIFDLLPPAHYRVKIEAGGAELDREISIRSVGGEE